MSTHNHTGSIHSNVTAGARRRRGPGEKFAVIDVLQANQPVVILCYSEGDTESFQAPGAKTANTSNAWDFVVINDNDTGGYVADVLIETGGDIKAQLGPSGTCQNLAKRLTS